MLWLLILSMCLQFNAGDYWLWHLHPARTKNFATALNEHVLSLVQTFMGANIDTAWSDFARSRLALPIRFKGMGILSVYRWTVEQYKVSSLFLTAEMTTTTYYRAVFQLQG